MTNKSSRKKPHGPHKPHSIEINPRMLTIPMVAIYLSATNWFVEELIRNKTLPATKYGKAWVVDLHDINVWIDEEKRIGKMLEARVMTDEQAQQFFAGVEKEETEHGTIIKTIDKE